MDESGVMALLAERLAQANVAATLDPIGDELLAELGDDPNGAKSTFRDIPLDLDIRAGARSAANRERQQ